MEAHDAYIGFTAWKQNKKILRAHVWSISATYIQQATKAALQHPNKRYNINHLWYNLLHYKLVYSYEEAILLASTWNKTRTKSTRNNNTPSISDPKTDEIEQKSTSRRDLEDSGLRRGLARSPATLAVTDFYLHTSTRARVWGGEHASRNGRIRGREGAELTANTMRACGGDLWCSNSTAASKIAPPSPTQ
jgi:hypothetical protein